MANNPVVIPGLPANYATPGVFIHTAFAQGAASSGVGDYSVIMFANKTSAGSATTDTVIYGPDTPVALSNEQDAIDLSGQGSEAHRMVKKFMAVNQINKLYVVFVSDGYGAAAAEGDITVTGTATGAATLRIFVQDEYVDVGIATDDTADDIAANAVVAINSKLDWAVTADNVAGVVTLTSKQVGLRANFIRYSAQVLPTSAGVSVTPIATTALTGGTVSDDNTLALATVLASGKRFYYHVSAAEDSTQLNNILDQLKSQSVATVGIRQRLLGASVDTLSNATAVSLAVNHERAELVWSFKSDWTPAELAANAGAVYSFEEQGAAFRLNFNNYGNDPDTSSYWRVPAPRSSGVAATPIQIEAALNSGLSPIRVQDGGATSLERRITTRFKSGSALDYRIRESHKVTVEDRFADDLGLRTMLVMAGKTIAQDPVGNEASPPGAMTPLNYKNLIRSLINEYNDNGRLVDVALIITGTRVFISNAEPDRIYAEIPLRPIPIWNSTAIRINGVA